MARRDESEGRQERMSLLVAELEASGQSVVRFARERGLSPWTLYEWRRRLRRQNAPSERKPFIEVKLIDEPSAVTTMSIELPSGLRVHVPRGFEAEELRRLVGVLSSC